MSHDTRELVARLRVKGPTEHEKPNHTYRRHSIERAEAADAITSLAERIEKLEAAESGYGDTLGSAAVGHMREMYPAAYEALGASGRRSLRNFVNARAAISDRRA